MAGYTVLPSIVDTGGGIEEILNFTFADDGSGGEYLDATENFKDLYNRGFNLLIVNIARLDYKTYDSVTMCIWINDFIIKQLNNNYSAKFYFVDAPVGGTPTLTINANGSFKKSKYPYYGKEWNFTAIKFKIQK